MLLGLCLHLTFVLNLKYSTSSSLPNQQGPPAAHSVLNFSKITQYTQQDCASVLETDLWSLCPSFFTANVLVLKVLFSFADCSVFWKALVCESKRRYLATWKMCFCSLTAKRGTLWFMISVSRLPRTVLHISSEPWLSPEARRTCGDSGRSNPQTH